MAEEQIYAGQGVEITTARAVIHGTTYAVSSISSVRVVTLNKSIVPLLLATVWVPVPLCCSNSAIEAATSTKDVTMVVLTLAVVGFMAFGPGIAALAYLGLAPSRHAVVIGTSSGERQGLTTTSLEQARAVEAAINDAVIRRG